MDSHDKEFLKNVLTFFNSPDELAKSLIERDLQKRVLDWWHFRPQVEFLADKKGRCKMDFLIKFENLEKGFKDVHERLGCGLSTLPHFNKGKVTLEGCLNEESRAIIRCLYQEDLRLWENCPD